MSKGREHKAWQQNTCEHTPKKKLKGSSLIYIQSWLKGLSAASKRLLSYLMPSVFRETGSCTFFINKRNSRDTWVSTINFCQECKTLNFDQSLLTKGIPVWVGLLPLSSRKKKINHSHSKINMLYHLTIKGSVLASESITNPKATFKYT